MNGSRIILSAFLVCCVLVPARAQNDTLFLTLSDCVRLAREQGPSAVIARRTYENREFAYRAFTSSFYPQLSLQGDAPGYNRSIYSVTQSDGSVKFLPQSQASSSLTMALTQKIPFTGGDLSIVSGISRIDLLEANTQSYRTTPLSLTLRQPIFQINSYAWNRETQDMQFRIAERSYVESAEDVAIEAATRFFDYYNAAMSYDNAVLNLAINDTLYQLSKGRYNVGKIAENELLQSELQVLNAGTQVENARMALDRAAENLKKAVGLPQSQPVALIPPSKIPQFSVNPEFALAQAQQNRSDALDYELQTLNAERSVRQAQSDNFLGATITANFGWNKNGTQIPDAYTRARDQEQFSVGFSMPIFKWGGGSAAVDAARAEQQRVATSVESQKFSFDQEVRYQVERLRLLQKQVGVAAKADTVAQRRFDVAKDRYLIGKIDVTNLFLAQSEKDNSRRTNIQTLADFWISYYRVRRLTLYDFESNIPLVMRQQ